MSKAVYIGSGETAHKVAGMYIGVDGLARKVTKGYIGAGGLARQFYSAAQPFAYAYTGAYTESEITIDGVAYTMLTITGSGTLTVNRAISADVWLCGGGGNGASGNGWPASFPNVSGGGGGGGGYIASANVQLSSDITCVIGAAAGATSLGAVLPTKTAEAVHLAAAERTTERVPARVEAETEAILFLRDLEFLTLIALAAAQAAFLRVATTTTEVQVAATGAMAAIPNAFRLALLLAALAEQKAAALVEARYLTISLQMPDITLHFMAVAVAAADRQETNLAPAPALGAAAIRA